MKALDLAAKPLEAVYEVREIGYPDLPYAELAPSVACAVCGELTMATKMIDAGKGKRLCAPCAKMDGHHRQQA
jgi:formylmethanofuran dehydrogenase subunit E